MPTYAGPLLNFGVSEPVESLLSSSGDTAQALTGLKSFIGSGTDNIQGVEPSTLGQAPAQAIPTPVPQAPEIGTDQPLLTQPKLPPLSAGQIIGAIFGGPAAGNAIRQQRVQQQISGVMAQYLFGVDKALKDNDIDKAESFVREFNKYSDLTPAALELQKKVIDRVNAQRANIEGNNAIIGMYKPHINDKVGKSVVEYRETQKGRLNPKQTEEAFKNIFPKIEVGPAGSRTFSQITGQPTGTYSTPEQVQGKDFPEPIQQALITAGIPRELYAFVKNKVEAEGSTDPAHRAVYEYINNAVKQQAAQNVRIQQFPIAQQIQTGATSQQVQSITGAPGISGDTSQVSSPQIPAQAPNLVPAPPGMAPTHTQVQTGPTPNLTQSEADVLITSVKNSGLPAEQQRQAIAAINKRLGKSSTSNTAADLRQQQIDAQARETAATTEARLDIEKTQEPSEKGAHLVRLDAQGNIQTPDARLTEDERIRLGFADLKLDKDLSQTVQNYSAVKTTGKELLQDLEKSVPTVTEGWIKALTYVFARGTQIPTELPIVGGTNIKIPGGSVALTNKQVELLQKLHNFGRKAEAIVNPGGQSSSDMAIIKDAIVGGFSGRNSITQAVNTTIEIAYRDVAGKLQAVNERSVDRRRETPVPFRNQEPEPVRPRGDVSEIDPRYSLPSTATRGLGGLSRDLGNTIGSTLFGVGPAQNTRTIRAQRAAKEPVDKSVVNRLRDYSGN